MFSRALRVVGKNSLKRGFIMTDQEASDHNAPESQPQDIEKLLKATDNLIKEMRSDPTIEPGSFAWFNKDQKIKSNQFILKRMRADFNKLLDDRRTVVFKAFYSDFCLAIEQYAKNNNYDLIISVTDKELKGENSFDVLNEITLKTLHYYSPALDRTDQIIAVMNRIYEKKK